MKYLDVSCCVLLCFVNMLCVSRSVHGTDKDGAEGKIFYRLFEDIIVELLQDARLKDFLEYVAKPLHNGKHRLFGPFSSGLRWEQLQQQFPGKSIILLLVYSDATEFFKGLSAHPIFGTLLPPSLPPPLPPPSL